MTNKPVSPRRPRGPGMAVDPSVAAEHGKVETGRGNYAGSSRSSLFGLFRRQPSRSSLAVPQAAQSVRSGGADSYFGAFDNISVGAAVPGLESPQQAHETSRRTKRMLEAATKFRESIEGMATAAVDFGNTLYECAETKGAASGHHSLPGHTVDADLQAAGGLHLLVANHMNILASSVVANVEQPLGEEFTTYQERIAAKEQEFKIALRRKMAMLRDSDAQRQRDARKCRDLGSYRSSLLDLTYQIDDINRLKVEFLGDIHTLSTELAERLHAAIASTVTAEIEVFDSIARKGWSGGGLDGLLAGCPDPFEPSKPNTIKSTIPPRSQTNGRSTTAAGSHSPRSPQGGASRSSPPRSPGFDGSFDLSKRDDSGSNSVGKPSNGSPNLFSIIPPGPIIPRDSHHPSDEDDDDDDDDIHDNDNNSRTSPHRMSKRGRDVLPTQSSPRGRHSRPVSDVSEIINLTLTPVRPEDSSRVEPAHNTEGTGSGTTGHRVDDVSDEKAAHTGGSDKGGNQNHVDTEAIGKDSRTGTGTDKDKHAGTAKVSAGGQTPKVSSEDFIEGSGSSKDPSIDKESRNGKDSGIANDAGSHKESVNGKDWSKPMTSGIAQPPDKGRAPWNAGVRGSKDGEHVETGPQQPSGNMDQQGGETSPNGENSPLTTDEQKHAGTNRS